MVTRPRFLHVITTAMLALCLARTSSARSAPNAPSLRLPAHEPCWVVLIDDLHLDFRRTGAIRSAVTAVVRPIFEAGALCAIRSDGPASLALAVSDATSWLTVTGAIKGITGNGLKPSDVMRMLTERGGARELVYRARRTSAAVELLLRGADERPVVLLLVSSGYRTDVSEVSEQLAAVAVMAGQSRVPVVALDPRVFAAEADLRSSVPAIETARHVQATTTSLQLLAHDTEGTVWEEGASLASVVARLPMRVR